MNLDNQDGLPVGGFAQRDGGRDAGVPRRQPLEQVLVSAGVEVAAASKFLMEAARWAVSPWD